MLALVLYWPRHDLKKKRPYNCKFPADISDESHTQTKNKKLQNSLQINTKPPSLKFLLLQSKVGSADLGSIFIQSQVDSVRVRSFQCLLIWKF